MSYKHPQAQAQLKAMLAAFLETHLEQTTINANVDADLLTKRINDWLEQWESYSRKISGSAEERNLENPRFPGDPDYREEKDKTHLTKQMLKVFDLMMDGEWHTNAEIERRTGVPSPSATACYRAFRREEWGGHTVLRQRVEHSRERRYKLIPNTEALTYRNYISSRTLTHE